MNKITNQYIAVNINAEILPIRYEELQDLLEIKLLKYEAVRAALCEITKKFVKGDGQKLSYPEVDFK